MKSLGREKMMSMALKMASKKKKISKKITKQKSRSGDISIFLQSEIICEILSRLPVKTLMRFQCVCKGWLSLIKDDSYFIDLHLTRSKLRPSFNLSIPRNGCCSHQGYLVPHKADILISDLSETGKIAARATRIVDNVRKSVSLKYDGILKPVNGLICFTNRRTTFGVCIYNLSTRELSPWIRTTLAIKNTRHDNYFPTYQFGFDPATKEHKVICMWKDKKNDSAYVGTEVMTVGTNTWRIIDEVPNHHLAETSVYANGSIYWITYDLFISRAKSEREVLVVAFNVRSEKFKTIAVPKSITNQFGKGFTDVTHLLDVNGQVALSSILPHGNIAKLWILDGEKITNNITTNWREVTLQLPFLWDRKQWVEFHGIAGTDQILLEAYPNRDKMKHVSLYSYNWKTKAFRKVETCELYSSIHKDCNSITLSKYYKREASLCETFTESLLRVRNK